MAKLEGLNVTLNHLVNMQYENKKLLEASGVIRHGIGVNDLRFNEKYSLELPCVSAEEFEKFNSTLQNNANCYNDFVSILYKF